MGLLFTPWVLNIVIFFITLILLGYVYFTWNFGYWKKRGVKFVKPTPVLGNFGSWALLRTDIGGMFRELYHKGKGTDLLGIWVFRKPALVVISPELMKSILVKDFHCFADRSTCTDREHDPLGSDNLFFGKNPHWKLMRIKLTHLFSSAKMRSMFDLMNEISKDLEECIRRQGDNPVEVRETCARFTTDVIATTAYGLKANTLLDVEAPFNIFRKRLLDFRFFRSIEFMSIFFMQGFAKYWKCQVFETDLAEWMRNVFWKTVKEREKTQELRNDLIGTLINLKNQTKEDDAIKFTGDSLVAQAAVFFTAGNESSSTTMSLLLYYLALNTEIQEKLVSEIEDVMKKYNDSDLTYDALHEMTYLEMCVKEILRMFPPLPFLDRECTVPYRVPGSNLLIEKGTIVYIPLMGVQTDETYFKDPYTFRPERFDKTKGEEVYPFSFLPFGEGPRNCIGERYGMLQTRIGIIRILRNFKVERCGKTQVPLQWQSLSLSPTAKDGIYVRFVKRQNPI